MKKKKKKKKKKQRFVYKFNTLVFLTFHKFNYIYNQYKYLFIIV